ncbi:MAG: BsaWI family type II restriction enzyme [candidate division WOR-3 bacterium]
MNKEYTSWEERQSYVAKSGKALERRIAEYLKQELTKDGIKIYFGNEIKREPLKYKALYEYLLVPTKESKSKGVWGDVDLVVADTDDYPIAIISCKTSFHGRFPETFFYSILFRVLTRVKFVLVTDDAGRAKKKEWESELGSEEKPTKDRELASTFLDGVYTTNKRTALGGIVKFITDLPKDILYWRKGLIKTHPKGV